MQLLQPDDDKSGHVIGTPYAAEGAVPLLVLAAGYDPACARLAQQLGHGTPSWRLGISLLTGGLR
ncbi:hypothetical protein ACP93_04360 [Xanthomonas sp. NCPPB 1128]|nr:hypothetical protein ACP93_04360 [Xanthomonas sp. NCPPB 1128]